MTAGETRERPAAWWELPYLLGVDTALIPLIWGYACCLWCGYPVTATPVHMVVTSGVWAFALASRLPRHRSDSTTGFYHRHRRALRALLLILIGMTSYVLLLHTGRILLREIQLPLCLGIAGLALGLRSKAIGRWLQMSALTLCCYLPASYLDICGHTILTVGSPLLLPWLLFVLFSQTERAAYSRALRIPLTCWLILLAAWSLYLGRDEMNLLAQNICYTTAIGAALAILLLCTVPKICPEAVRTLRSPAMAAAPLLSILLF